MGVLHILHINAWPDIPKSPKNYSKRGKKYPKNIKISMRGKITQIILSFPQNPYFSLFHPWFLPHTSHLLQSYRAVGGREGAVSPGHPELPVMTPQFDVAQLLPSAHSSRLTRLTISLSVALSNNRQILTEMRCRWMMVKHQRSVAPVMLGLAENRNLFRSAQTQVRPSVR